MRRLQALVGLGVTTGVTYLVVQLTEDEPAAPQSEQVESLRTEAAQAGMPVEALQRVDFRGTGEPSYVVVQRDARSEDPARPAGLRSDQLRVLDVRDGRLVGRSSSARTSTRSTRPGATSCRRS
jgi:hypothetical protein